jgi:hypothetical protein
VSRIYEALKKAEELRSASEGTQLRPLWPGSFTGDSCRAEHFPMPQFRASDRSGLSPLPDMIRHP